MRPHSLAPIATAMIYGPIVRWLDNAAKMKRAVGRRKR